MDQRVRWAQRWQSLVKHRLEEGVAYLRSQRERRVSSHQWTTDWDIGVIKASEVDRHTWRSEPNDWVVISKQIGYSCVHKLHCPGGIVICRARSSIEQWERVVSPAWVDWSERLLALTEWVQTQDWVWIIKLIVSDTTWSTPLLNAFRVPLKQRIRELKLDSFYYGFLREEDWEECSNLDSDRHWLILSHAVAWEERKASWKLTRKRPSWWYTYLMMS